MKRPCLATDLVFILLSENVQLQALRFSVNGFVMQKQRLVSEQIATNRQGHPILQELRRRENFLRRSLPNQELTRCPCVYAQRIVFACHRMGVTSVPVPCCDGTCRGHNQNLHFKSCRLSKMVSAELPSFHGSRNFKAKIHWITWMIEVRNCFWKRKAFGNPRNSFHHLSSFIRTCSEKDQPCWTLFGAATVRKQDRRVWRPSQVSGPYFLRLKQDILPRDLRRGWAGSCEIKVQEPR